MSGVRWQTAKSKRSIGVLVDEAKTWAISQSTVAKINPSNSSDKFVLIASSPDDGILIVASWIGQGTNCLMSSIAKVIHNSKWLLGRSKATPSSWMTAINNIVHNYQLNDAIIRWFLPSRIRQSIPVTRKRMKILQHNILLHSNATAERLKSL